MDMRSHFIQATDTYNDRFGTWVSAPCIRKSFRCETDTTAHVTVAACGFYELFVNGVRCTRGRLSPYISNAEDYIYFDSYDLPLKSGENVVAFLLGNGFLNNAGGYIWDFDKASIRTAPMVSMVMQYPDGEGRERTLVTDGSFRTAPSAILTDDYRFGEVYDATQEQDGWNDRGFDDSDWSFVHAAEPPCGELKRCEAPPIVVEKELSPKRIIPCEDGYVYDFGESNAGVCRLHIDGKPGQKITLQHADWIQDDGELCIENLWFVQGDWDQKRGMVQCDTYTCRGGRAVWEPLFTYHGFRYVKVTGVTPEQATASLLTYVVFHTKLETRGDFTCSDEVVNQLQACTRRSDVSNFHHFPTDCPQREKNGWTADAALSSEQMLLNFNPESSYREWMRNICKAQNAAGALPGIVPTYGWGFQWGNGPAWDSVLAYLPYFVYVYRGETDMIRESASSFTAYLKYLLTRRDEKGLIHIGLGDWCEVDRPAGEPTAPLAVTDTILSMDIARKMAVMYGAVGMTEEQEWAEGIARTFRRAIRESLVDFSTMTVAGCCQTSQAMGLFYGVFEESEKEAAFDRLLERIHQSDDHMQCGVLGARVLFHVLADFGESDLAYRMITRPDYPSYGNWIARGATTLWESFAPENRGPRAVSSMNHHFWGDISSWFIQYLAGIRFNPRVSCPDEVDLRPCFVADLTFADGFYLSPMGKIRSAWTREDEHTVIWTVEIPDGMKAALEAPDGYGFEDGTSGKVGKSGVYRLHRAI